ncbi:MAG TPA: TIGR03546 family protein [Spirochaetota bacterium]|nr:TIGR03546 family protein [Spirochaetota bacterium]
MFILKFIAKGLKLLNSDETPLQIALGIALGSIIAFTPLLSLHNFFILLLIFILKVSFRGAITAMVLLKPAGLLLAPLANELGFLLLLDIESLHPLWVYLHTLPFFAFFLFNNTLVFGSFILALLLFLPVLFLFKTIINKYRTSWKEKFLQTKLYKILSKSKIVLWITKIYKLIPA